MIARAGRRPLRWLIAGWVSLNLLFHAAEFQQALNLRNRPEMRGLADIVAANMKPGDAVLCLDLLSYHPLKYHARGRFEIRQLRREGVVVNHYSGGPIFRDEDFLADPDPAALFLRNDSIHFTPRGHAHVAARLREWLAGALHARAGAASNGRT